MENIGGALLLLVATCAVLVSKRASPRSQPGCFEQQVSGLLANVSASTERLRSLPGVRRAVQRTLDTVWPGSTVKLFGSLSTGLGSPTSDMDLSVSLPGLYPDHSVIERAKAAFEASPHLYQQVHTRTRLPALTFHFAPADITCDLHFRVEPYETVESSLLHYLLHLDQRALNLAIIVKRWAKLHKIIYRKYLTSYGMMLLVIFFLQQRSVLPAVIDLQNNIPAQIINGTCQFNVAFEKRTLVSKNSESLYEILGAFFEYYEDFDFDNFVVSAFVGRPVLKKCFEDLSYLSDEFYTYKRNVAMNITKPFNLSVLCIQSILMLNDNCGWRVDSTENFKRHFVNAAKSYRENEMCSFLKAINIIG